MSVLVIAEAGVNHNGDRDLARELVAVAARAGADLVKFQTFDADRLTTHAATQTPYQKRNTGKRESQHAMLKRLELSADDHAMLIGHCKRHGIGFFSTGFDEQSIDLLLSLGIERLKVPSGEITNLPYLRKIGTSGKPVIVSTGMATLDEVRAAVDALTAAGTPREHVTVLQCTTDYPAPVATANLRAMVAMGEALDVAFGYSDHTAGIETAIAAVALGATVIEKHFTLDRALPGPDHKASLEPEELAALVTSIRNVEAALGDGVKRVTESEAINKPIVRKSLVAARPIQAGEPFGEDNLVAKRPGTGISPMRWDEVVGRPAPRDFDADEMIEL